MGGEPEIIEERTSEVSMYQPIGPKTAASVLIRNEILNFTLFSPDPNATQGLTSFCY